MMPDLDVSTTPLLVPTLPHAERAYREARVREFLDEDSYIERYMAQFPHQTWTASGMEGQPPQWLQDVLSHHRLEAPTAFEEAVQRMMDVM